MPTINWCTNYWYTNFFKFFQIFCQVGKKLKTPFCIACSRLKDSEESRLHEVACKLWGFGRDGEEETVVSMPHSNVQLLVYPMIGHYFVTGYFNTYFSHLASRMLSFTYMSSTETLPHCTF